MNNMSFTIPTDDKRVLVATATMLLTLAGKIPEMELDDQQPDDVVVPYSKILTPGNSNGLTAEELAPIIPPVPEQPAAPVDAGAVFGASTPSNPPEQVTTVSDQIDADGLPWDARIHAGTKTKNADGRWKRRKGVDDADYQRIVGELRTLMLAPVHAPMTEEEDAIRRAKQISENIRIGNGHPDTPPPAAVAPTPPAPPAAPVVPAPPTAAAPVTPPPAAAPATPVSDAAPVVPAGDAMTFAEFLKAVMGKIQAKTVTMPQVNEVIAKHGVANLQLVGSRLDLIPQLWADIEAIK